MGLGMIPVWKTDVEWQRAKWWPWLCPGSESLECMLGVSTGLEDRVFGDLGRSLEDSDGCGQTQSQPSDNLSFHMLHTDSTSTDQPRPQPEYRGHVVPTRPLPAHWTP